MLILQITSTKTRIKTNVFSHVIIFLKVFRLHPLKQGLRRCCLNGHIVAYHLQITSTKTRIKTNNLINRRII